MNEHGSVSRVIPLAHQLLREVLQEGDRAVDLTAGNGHDTLFLWQQVGPGGLVVSSDIQVAALDATEARLTAAGATVRRCRQWDAADFDLSGVQLVQICHSRLELSQPLRGVLANLGYLPGGDKDLVTSTETTVAALNSSLAALEEGGRLVVVLYPGHQGGGQEAAAVDALLSALEHGQWLVVRFEVANAPRSPYLISAEKRITGRKS